MIVRRIIAAIRAWWASTAPEVVRRELAEDAQRRLDTEIRLGICRDHVARCLENGEEPAQWALDAIE